jgi:hypothetical protein
MTGIADFLDGAANIDRAVEAARKAFAGSAISAGKASRSTSGRARRKSFVTR